MMKPTDIDPSSRTWRAIRAWAEKGLKRSRDAIETPGYGTMETEFERGRIAALRELVALPAPRPGARNEEEAAPPFIE